MATKYYPVEPNFSSLPLPASLLALLNIGPARSVGGSLDLRYPAWVIYTPGAQFVGSYGMNKFLFRTRFESDLTYVSPLEWSRGVDIFSLAGKANIPVMLDSSWAEGGPSSAYVPPPETLTSQHSVAFLRAAPRWFRERRVFGLVRAEDRPEGVVEAEMVPRFRHQWAVDPGRGCEAGGLARMDARFQGLLRQTGESDARKLTLGRTTMHERFIHLTLAAAVVCFALERAYAAPAAPVACWSFDGSGSDSSGNGNDAKLLGKVSYVPGMHGQAVQFQGTGNYFRVTNNPTVQLRSTQQFSVTAYVQPGTLDQQVILYHGRGGSTRPSWFLAVQGDLPYPNTPLYPGSFVFGVRASRDPAYTALTAKAVAGRWVHLAATYDGATLKLYADGILQSSAAAPLPYDNAEYLHIGGDPGVVSGRSWYTGLLDDVCIFSQALTAEEVKAVMQGPAGPQLAHDPHPAHTATDVPEDTFLNWTAGQFAATHDVYLGKSFADVNNASRSQPGSVLVSRGQTATTYIPAAILDIGQTYYWRVDEVNKAPSNTIFKGTYVVFHGRVVLLSDPRCHRSRPRPPVPRTAGARRRPSTVPV